MITISQTTRKTKKKGIFQAFTPFESLRLRKSKKNPLLVNNPLDPLGILLFMIATFVLANLVITFAEGDDFGLSSGSQRLIIRGFIGFSLMIFSHILFSRKQPRIMLKLSFEPERDIAITFITLFGYISVQTIGLILSQVELFAVTKVNVYSFFTAGAIVEEMLYRYGLVTFLQSGFSYFIQRRKKKITPQDLLGINFAVILLTSIYFAADHDVYYGNPIGLFTVFAGVLFLSWSLLSSKLIFPAMIAHAFINFIAAGGFIQSYGGLLT